MNDIKLKSIIVILTMVFFIYQLSSQDSISIKTSLNYIRIHLENKETIKALDKLEKLCKNPNLKNDENLIVAEEIYWEVAIQYLNYANLMKDEKSIKHYANLSYAHWENYIKWYHALTIDEKDELGRSHTRIKLAVIHIGNAIIRSREIFSIFSEYSEIIDIKYLSIGAFKLWKNWLYSYPSWQHIKSVERSSLRRRKICSSENSKNLWLNYALTLKGWVNTTNLRSSILRGKLREINQIINISKNCKF